MIHIRMNTCLKCLEPLDIADAHYGLHKPCFFGWFKCDALAEFTGLQKKSADSRGPEGKTNPRSYNTSFFHGKFKKYSAELAGTSYIFKMRESEAPELPEVEYLCNQIADALGVPVANHFLIEFFGDRVFVTQNFIKKGGAQANLSHIYHFVGPEEPYSCETLIISAQTQRPYDVEIFVQTCLFDSLVGNHDRHGRNLGLVVTPTRIALSPIYDNVSYLSLESGPMLQADFSPAGKVATSTEQSPTIKAYVQEFIRLGMGDLVLAFHSKIKLAKIIALIDRSFCSAMMKDAIKRLVTKRYQELSDELATRRE